MADDDVWEKDGDGNWVVNRMTRRQCWFNAGSHTANSRDTIDRLTAALRPFAVARASIENLAADMGAEPVPFPDSEHRPITPDGSGQTALAVFLDVGGDLSAAPSEEPTDG